MVGKNYLSMDVYPLKFHYVITQAKILFKKK